MCYEEILDRLRCLWRDGPPDVVHNYLASQGPRLPCRARRPSGENLGEDETTARARATRYWTGYISKHPRLVQEVEEDKKRRKQSK